MRTTKSIAPGNQSHHAARVSQVDQRKPQVMNKITVQLPESLQRSIQSLADLEGYTVDQFLASAAGEKMAALRTLDYFRREAANGRREDVERFLAAVPNQTRIETDRVPDERE
jgi:hypothetical protein